MEPIQHLQQILSDPTHPLYAVNKTYQDYLAVIQQANRVYGIAPPASSERKHWARMWVAHIRPALSLHEAEERKLVDAGVHFMYVSLPVPWIGYFILQEPHSDSRHIS